MTDHPRSRADMLAVLRAHEAEFRARGVETITLFGSVARDDAAGVSDVDLAVRPGAGFSNGGFDHFGRLVALRERLGDPRIIRLVQKWLKAASSKTGT
jgi:predicted nucleotidyltransferase